MSDERERAEYYEAHQGDPGEWGEPEPAKPRRRLASMFSVRLAPDELEAVRNAAERRGLSVSAFLRRAALNEARADHPASVTVQARSYTNVAVTALSAPAGADLDKLFGSSSGGSMTADAA